MSNENIMELRRNMICRIVAEKNAYFKAQQKSDPDMTYEEKYSIANELFDINPGTFLERYGNLIKEEDLPCFDSMPQNDMVDYHKKLIEHKLARKPNVRTVKNRRYKKMLELMKDGEYFSEGEMKRRCPLMHERMLGKYLDKNKIHVEPMAVENTLSTFCLKHLEAMQNNELYNKQLEEEENNYDGCLERHDDDDDEEEEEEEDECDDDDDDIDDMEIDLLRKEFLENMQTRFLDGLDEDFDYEKIDNDGELDPHDLIDRDLEEKYFDDDDGWLADDDDERIDDDD